MARWVVATERTMSEVVGAPAAAVRDFYTDLDNLTSLHPFLAGVRRTERTQTENGYRQSYRVRERIPLGPLRIPISFRATLTVPMSGPVTSVSLQFPQIRLDSTMAFDDGGYGTTLVVEHLRIAAPRPLAAFTVRAAIAAHTDMLAGIRRHFDTS